MSAAGPASEAAGRSAPEIGDLARPRTFVAGDPLPQASHPAALGAGWWRGRGLVGRWPVASADLRSGTGVLTHQELVGIDDFPHPGRIGGLASGVGVPVAELAPERFSDLLGSGGAIYPQHRIGIHLSPALLVARILHHAYQVLSS